MEPIDSDIVSEGNNLKYPTVVRAITLKNGTSESTLVQKGEACIFKYTKDTSLMQPVIRFAEYHRSDILIALHMSFTKAKIDSGEISTDLNSKTIDGAADKNN